MWIQLVDENNRKVKNQNQIHVFGDWFDQELPKSGLYN